ncbi:COQ9 family protein [Pseudoroseomonas globiformis]|uniref:COQ9 family protein n=1 Tax=Teichococcus globiformis TaxID=2307229 RepID=A0ABV7FYX4_9PROT
MSRMPPALERSAERDAALRAAVPFVPRFGWGEAALRAGLRADGTDPDAAVGLFPQGPAAMVEAWTDLADRDMAGEAAGAGLDAMRVPLRIRTLMEIRLRQRAPHREAVRRAVAVLALPWNYGAAARATARTVDAMWLAAGDHSADASYYTRRATLAGIYAATLSFWLQDPDPEGTATLAFLDRRLEELGRFQKLKARSRSFTARRGGGTDRAA